ncbi:Tm-1-like ATP-binding domain-containing protein [Brachybacterium vulturis]|uniref:Tm-1-like ATP-binding domain-containing protein n=1 Tax=Brachybacterium vulturis TaxID=2017484 RepID=UPI0037361C50
MTAVALLGTFDTKGPEYKFVGDVLARMGVEPHYVDVGVLGSSSIDANVTRDEIAQAAGMSLNEVRELPDRGAAIAAMARGATSVALDLIQRNQIAGILALGGTGGTTLSAQVMRALPVGFPKLIVSTVASGETRHYVGAKDITLMYSVVDIAGVNAISAPILSNAAAAVAGMALAERPEIDAKPVITASMFGLTTPAVTAARERLESLGYEVLVFHATGAGGDSMEAIVEAGLAVGVLDITTTELADELVGGVFAASSSRLTAAGHAGVPHVVSPGALDMVNFGPASTVPAEHKDRTFYHHNDSVTLMRTSAEELQEIARRMANRLNAREDREATIVFLPEAGFSGIDVEEGAFFDPAADAAFIETLTNGLDPTIRVIRRPVNINDPEFAVEMADTLDRSIRTTQKGK